MHRLFGCFALLFGVTWIAPAAEPTVAPPPRAKVPAADAPVSPGVPKMPLTGLTPAKPMFDACLYHYPVGTASKECQAYVDQALGMYYSYVWIEAARAAETAVRHDPCLLYTSPSPRD